MTDVLASNWWAGSVMLQVSLVFCIKSYISFVINHINIVLSKSSPNSVSERALSEYAKQTPLFMTVRGKKQLDFWRHDFLSHLATYPRDRGFVRHL